MKSGSLTSQNFLDLVHVLDTLLSENLWNAPGPDDRDDSNLSLDDVIPDRWPSIGVPGIGHQVGDFGLRLAWGVDHKNQRTCSLQTCH